MVVVAASDGLGAPDSIRTGVNFYPNDWTSGDRLVGYTDTNKAMYLNLAGGDRSLHPLVDSSQVFVLPAVSPDGRFVAGVSQVNSGYHVFVQTLEGPPGRWQISSGQNAFVPRWTKGGRELVYESTDGNLMSVDIDTRQGFHAGVPHTLFALPVPSPAREISYWDVDATGERFIVIAAPRNSTAGRTMEVVTDLRALVERK